MTRKVLVTGASRGIGKAIALLLSENGYPVVGTTRNPGLLSEDLKPHSSPIHFVKMDVADIAAVPGQVAQAAHILGGIDVLVNNAGISHIGPFEEMPDEQARKVMMTNFFGAGAVIRATLPYLRNAGGGMIVNVTSLAGRLGIPYQSFYCASKFALEGLSESLRLELASQNIRVVVVEPGDIRTDIGEHRLMCEAVMPHNKAGYAAACRAINRAVGSSGPPADVARVVLKVIGSRHPRLRYVAGKGAASTRLLAGLLPYRLVELLVRRHFGV